MIDLRHLRHALALAEHRSYARASEALHLSQSALSRSISSLERTLDVPLFDRGKGEVRPTPYGKAVLRRAREVLSASEEIVRDVRLVQGAQLGDLDFAVGPHVGSISVATALARFLESHPGIEIRLEVQDWHLITQYVLDGTVDFGVAEASAADRDPRLQVEWIAEHRAAFYCNPDHPLLREGRAPPLGRILAYPLIGPPIPPRAARAFQRARGDGANTGRRDTFYSPKILSGDFAVAKHVIVSSQAVSFAPILLLDEEIESGRVVPLFVDEPWMRYQFGFIYERGRTLSPSALALMEEIRAAQAEAAQREEALSMRHAASRGASAGGLGT